MRLLRLSCFLVAITFLGCEKTKVQSEAQSEVLGALQERERIAVSGSVFIATKGGQNYKLGLVPVHGVTVSSYRAAMAEFQAKINKVLNSDLQVRFLPIPPELAHIQSDLLPPVRNAFERAKAAKVKYDLIEKRLLTDPTIKVYRSIRKIYGKKSGARAYEVSSALNEAVDEFNHTCTTLETSLAKYQDAKKGLSSLVEQVSEMARPKCTNKITRDAAEYISSFADPEAISKTDADGQFTVNLLPEEQYFLIAYSQRQTGDSEQYDTEQYDWFYMLNRDQMKQSVQVLLANDSLGSPPELQLSITAVLATATKTLREEFNALPSFASRVKRLEHYKWSPP